MIELKGKGGPGRGQGRRHINGNPPGEGEYLKPRTVRIPAELVEYLTNLGGGNLSAGVRLAGEYHRTHQNAS